MAVPDGENLYDKLGTVLYRVVSEADYANEINGAGTMPGMYATSHSTNVPNRADETMGKQAASDDVTGADAAAKAALLSMSARYSTQGELQRTSILLSQTKVKNTTIAGDGVGKETNLVSRHNAGVGSAAAATNTLASTLGALGIAYRDGPGSELSSTANAMLSRVTTAERALDKIIPPQPCDDNVAQLLAGDASKQTAGTATHAAPPSSAGVRFVRAASLQPSSQLNVILLLQHLQRRCRDENARMCGVLCPTRESIFNDGMTELTRQITLLCPERGLLLDELCKSMAQTSVMYDNLFDSAAQYGVLKGIERDLRNHLFDDKKELESELRRHENRVNELRAKYNGMMKRFEEQKVATLAQHADEIAYIKKASKQLVNEIKRLAALESAPVQRG